LVLIKAEQLQQQIRCVEAVIEAGGNPILVGSDMSKLAEGAGEIDKQYLTDTFVSSIDTTDEQAIIQLKDTIFSKFDTYPDILINDSVVEIEYHDLDNNNTKLDEIMIEKWDKIIHEELTSTLLLTKVFGYQMAKGNGGVILNILSDIYLNPRGNIINSMKKIDDISLIAVTNGIFGLTKYIATYWNGKNIRSNSLTIGTCEQHSFNRKDRASLINQIPLGRLANDDEYKAAIIFLVSDASSYMTGSNLTINGGRTCW
jgi:NAD(P)-dependent dehydrogenase (short-subunit alcohol dehydrogenase family)